VRRFQLDAHHVCVLVRPAREGRGV